MTTPANTALAQKQQGAVNLKSVIERPEFKKRFDELLGQRAPQFIASLIQVGSSSKQLAECEPMTVIAAAITAAALDLPIDKNLGFAHIVPYKGQATFQIGAKGLIQLAVRTGQYRFLNNCVVYDGELTKYDELTGEIVIEKSNRKPGNKVIGYAAYFKLMNGYEHAEFWSTEEVNAHALKYSQAYKSGYETPWKSNFDAMALKTVIKSLLSHWGIMSVQMQTAIRFDQGVRHTPDGDDVSFPDNEPKTPQLTSEAPTINVESEKVDKAALERPGPTIIDWCKRDGVSEDQVIGWAKAKNDVNFCGQKVVEVIQMRDTTLQMIVTNWANILPAIKAVQI